MKYAPAWVLSVACSVITKRYVEEHVPFQSFINAFSGNFETLYDDLTESKLRAGVEMEMRFLASFDHENHMKIVNAHIFNVITYKKPKIKRKLKGIFSDGTKPKRSETSIAQNHKAFKAFFFRLRTDPKLEPDDAWNLSQVKGMDGLITIFNEPVHVSDAF